MGFGQTVASVARYAAATAVATIILYAGSKFALEKQTPNGATLGASIQTWKTSSGGQVGNFDELGNLTLSGSVAMQKVKNCSLVKTTSTGALACASVSLANEVGTSSFSGATLRLGDARYLKLSGGTVTGATTVDITGGNAATVGLKIIETLSGAQLHAERIMTASGNVISEQTISGAVLKAGEFSPRILMAQVVASGSAVSVGSGKLIVVVPRVMSGYILGEAHVAVQTAGATNTSTFRLRNITKNNRQFFGANPLSIDSAEVGSDTAATAPTFAANRDVGAYDRLSFDIMSVSTTAPKGLVLTLYFYK